MSLESVRSAGSLGGRLVLKDPVDKKCQEAGLKDCPNVTEGLLLYVEGKPEEGKEHLRIASATNSPENLKVFAQAINAIGTIPGTAQYVGPLLEAAKFLDLPTGTPVPQPAVYGGFGAEPQARVPQQGAESPSSLGTADDEGDRLVNGMATPLRNATSLRCGAGGIAASCVRAASGPLVVTGLSMIGHCNDRALALTADPSGDLGTPRWAASVTPNQPNLTGAKFLVRGGEALFVGLEFPPSSKTSAGCSVAWSGYRLRGTPVEHAAPAIALNPPAASVAGAAIVEALDTPEPASPRSAAAPPEAIPASVQAAPVEVTVETYSEPIASSGTIRPSDNEPQQDAKEVTTRPLAPSEGVKRNEVTAASWDRRFSLGIGTGYSHWSFPDSYVWAPASLNASVEIRVLQDAPGFNVAFGYMAQATFTLDLGSYYLHSPTLAVEYDMERAPLRLGLALGAAFKYVPDSRLNSIDLMIQPYTDLLFLNRRAGVRFFAMVEPLSSTTSEYSVGARFLLNL